MENSITLQWKEFSVPVDRLVVILRSLLSTNYDGIVCEATQFRVMFVEAPSQQDIDALDQFWSTATEIQFSPSLKEILTKKINEASAFGRALILDYAVDNVQLGITQSGKTRAVADYCRTVQRYLESGSLYAAVDQINDMIAAGTPAELSPFVTDAKLTTYRDKILTYLNTP